MRIRARASLATQRALLALGCAAALLGAPSPSAAQPSAAQPSAKPAGSAKADAHPSAKAPQKQASAAKVGAAPAPKANAKAPAGGKGAAVKPKKGPKRLARKAGEPGEPDEATRHVIAGTATPPGKSTRESPELRAMRELDLALFPSSAPSAGPPWVADGIPLLDRGEPKLSASGMPPSRELAPAPDAEPARDLSWLRQLDMPDIPVRWDARVVRYLEYYKNNPRGRGMVASWIKKSGRYGGSIRRILHEQGLPEDILWLALVESGFEPTISSPVGAAGLWQFMPEGARIYGLTVDRWVDERLDPERSTVAAARYLADLRQRFGGWELAFAAYNMGYGGLLASIRKYNTNDFWELSRLESGMPLETALYVPKIVAMAIVARNKAAFGCEDVELDPALSFDKVAVGSGVSLRSVALAAGAPLEQVEELNPFFTASRTPPLPLDAKADATWAVRVPPGTAPRAAKSIGKLTERDGKLTRYAVRWGETLEDIADARSTTRGTLQSLNGLRRDEMLRPGTVLFVPGSPGVGAAAAAHLVAEGPKAQPVVVVPGQAFSYPERQRLFYRVVPGDTARALADVFSVTADELCRWNQLDPGAALHEGMTLQVYAPKDRTFDDVRVLAEKDARVLPAGSREFFAYFEAQRGRKRVELVAREGDTWRSIAKRYGLTMGQLERINQRARSSTLSPGDKLVVYVPSSRAPEATAAEKRESKPDVAVAVAQPASDEAGAKEDDATKPATLRAKGE
jgi:membrane-bound lytic murein transglycosylase D